MKLRPKVGEVVRRVGEVAANWNGLMPPCARAAPSEELMSDSMEHSEFGILVFP